MTPAELLGLARDCVALGVDPRMRRSRGKPEHRAAFSLFRSACTPARIVALCELLERCADDYFNSQTPVMTTPLDALPESPR